MKARLILLAIFSIIASGCSSDSGGGSDVVEKTVTITFKNKEKTVLINDSFDLFTELTLENATREDVVWNSDNPKAVRIDGSMAKSVGEGEAVITAKVKNTVKQTSMKVIVRQQVLKFKLKELAIVNGKSFDLNELLDVKGIGSGDLVWSSADEGIVSVNKGIITPRREGTTTVSVQTKGGTPKDEIKITVKKNEIERIIFPAKIIEMYAMSNVEIPFKVVPEGASTAGIKWEIDNYSPIVVVSPGVLYSDQLADGDLTVTLPNGEKTFIRIRVVSRGILAITAPLGNELKVYEGNKPTLYLKLLPLGETLDEVEFIVDNPIITVDREGVITTYPGKRGITNLTIRSKTNPNVKLIMKIDVRNFSEYIYTDLNIMVNATPGGTYSGDGQINIWRYFNNDVRVSDFTLYDGNGRVLYADRSTYALDKVYKIKFDNVRRAYIEYTLSFQGVTEKKRVSVTPS